MPAPISPTLYARLERIAARRSTTVETLLTEYADQAERDPFPGDPRHFLDVSVALICVADLHGNFLYVNPAFCETLGYTEEELLAQPYKTFVHPDDVAPTRSAEEVIRRSGHITTFENRYRHKNGPYRWLSWASITRGEYTYGVALDVTQQKQIEGQLAQMTRQNDRILRSMFDGYLLGDIEGRILDVNQAYCDMLGYSRDELLTKTVFELDATLPSAQIAQAAEEIIEADVFMSVETQHRRKDGTVIDVEINNIQLEDGKIACFIRDITERKRLERQLRQSEQLYRGLIESQIDFVCRYTPDTVLVYVNDAYCQFFQRSREQLLGKPFITLAPATERKTIYDRIHEVLRDPSPQMRLLHSFDDGGNKRWIQWIDYGITDETGEVVTIQAVGRDVTRLMETQERLAEREEMLSTIFANIPVMLVQTDGEGNFEYVNQHWVEVLGWTIEEMQAHPDIWSEFYPDPEQKRLAQEAIENPQPGWFDGKTRTRDGRYIDTSWANVRLSNGRTLGIGQVITHRVELENQRIYARQLELELEKERELREMKERFVSLVSHEFRTPLAVMTTSIDMVLRFHERLKPERVQEKLETVREQIRRMVNLMEDTLRFSKASARKTPFRPQHVAICHFCQQIIETIRLTDDREHEFALQCDEGSVLADPTLLDHVLTNVLSNAVKYSPKRSTVAITVSQESDSWRFIVQDEGIGIPEEDLPHLFTPFHRAENAQELPGTGLGLSIAKDYVEIHGGIITVESELGEGTTFTFTLPSRG